MQISFLDADMILFVFLLFGIDQADLFLLTFSLTFPGDSCREVLTSILFVLFFPFIL